MKQVEEKTEFDFEASSAKSLELIRNEVDSVLAGTAIRREGSPEIDVGPGQLAVKLQLTSPEPLTGQTIAVLSSQLGSKLGLPVQLHGQDEMSGANFQLTLAPTEPGLTLGSKDLTALENVIKLLQQEQDLRLQAACTPVPSKAGGEETPRFVSEFRDMLLRSRLQVARWSIQIQPIGESSAPPAGEQVREPVEAEDKTPETAVPGLPHCDVKIFQDF